MRKSKLSPYEQSRLIELTSSSLARLNKPAVRNIFQRVRQITYDNTKQSASLAEDIKADNNYLANR